MTLKGITKNVTLDNLPNLLIIFVFSLILVLPPFLRGGREVLATFILLVFLLPLAYLIWRAKGKFELTGAKTPFIFLAVFILGMGASIFYSPEKYQALETFLHFLAYFLLFFLIFNFIDSQKHIRYFAYLVLGLGVILSIWGIYNFILSESFGYLRLISTFGWHIPFGEFLMYPLFLALSLVCLRPSKISSEIPLILLTSLFFITFYFNHTRGAWVSFLMVSFLLLLIFRKNILKREVLVALFIIILLSSIGISGLLQIKSQQAAKLSQQVLFSQETLKENAVTVRLYFWQRALEIFQDKPFFGGGLESFKSLHLQYLKPPFYYSSDPHNFYLKVLAEGGIILFLVFLGFVVSIMYYAFQVLQNTRSCLESSASLKGGEIFGLGMTGGIGAALIHNFLNVGWFFPANLIIFFLFSGIILKGHILSQKDEPGEHNKNPVFRNIGKFSPLPLFLIALILFLVGFALFVGDFYHERGKKFLWDGKSKEAIQNFQKALKFNPLRPEYNRSLAGAYFLLAKGDSENNSKFLEQALSFSEKTIEWTNNSEDFNFQGKIFSFQGELDLAEKSFWAAIEQNPQDFDGYLELAALYSNQNRLSEIHSLIEETVISQYQKEHLLSPLYIAPDKNLILLKFSILHNRNGEAYLKEENFEIAELEFQKSVSFYPQNEFAWRNLIFLKLREGDKNGAQMYLEEGWKNNPQSKILPDIEF